MLYLFGNFKKCKGVEIEKVTLKDVVLAYNKVFKE